MSPKKKDETTVAAADPKLDDLLTMPDRKSVERCQPLTTNVEGKTIGKRMTELDKLIRKAARSFTNQDEYGEWAASKVQEVMRHAANALVLDYAKKQTRKTRKPKQQPEAGATAQ
jgi:hypothetical protein